LKIRHSEFVDNIVFNLNAKFDVDRLWNGSMFQPGIIILVLFLLSFSQSV